MKNDLRREREIVESFNKPNEVIKYFEQLLKSPRYDNDTLGLGYKRTEEGESSKTTKERNDKGKNSKPIGHYYGNKGHIYNICRRKNTNQHDTPKNMGHCHKFNKQGH